MIPPKRPPVVRLTSVSDMCMIIKEVSEALSKAGADIEYIKRFKEEAFNYKTVLLTCYEYAEIVEDEFF